MTQAEWDDIVAKYPRHGFREGVKALMCGFCRTKPVTTYDNFVAEFGERFVEGYSREGRRTVDMILATLE